MCSKSKSRDIGDGQDQVGDSKGVHLCWKAKHEDGRQEGCHHGKSDREERHLATAGEETLGGFCLGIFLALVAIEYTDSC